MVLLYCGLDQSLREVASTFTLLEERITDEAVRKRLLACEPWVKALLSKMLPRYTPENLPDGLRFIAFDGSSIQAPGATGFEDKVFLKKLYPRNDYRLHIGIDLVSLEFTHLVVTDKYTGESLKQYPLGHGDVAIVDRGLCHANAILDIQGDGADVIARYHYASMPLYHDDETAFDLISWLKCGSVTYQSHSVLGGALHKEKVNGFEDKVFLQKTLSSNIIALRLSEKEARIARRRCRKEAARKGRATPSQTTLFLAGFILVFSTLPPQILSAEIVLELYQCRWQIELAIKRLKSLLDIDELRSKEGLAKVWLNGKLLYALMLEKRLRKRLGNQWGYLNQERFGTMWRPWKLLKQEIAPMITGVYFWCVENWPVALSVLFERPRCRKLQTLPKSIRKLLQFYPNLPIPNF